MLDWLNTMDRHHAYLDRLLIPRTVLPSSPTNRPVPQVTLAGYVQCIKGLELDPWQVDLCQRLERAFWLAQSSKFQFEERDEYMVAPSGMLIEKEDFEGGKSKGSQVAIHAGPQFGKSCIISQAYPAWIFGYDPLHRFRLATYNVFHSARFSVVVKHILYSPEHGALFPDTAGHIPQRTKAVEWSTNARLALNDGQASFSALGLASGFTGTGADTLLCDDPYKSAEEALSEVIRDKTWRFWTDTAGPRMNDQSNVFIMFHRYFQDDMGGRAIATGDFVLWRYAAKADGDYEDEETGLKWPDPLNRKVGEYLSPRFSKEYYDRQEKNQQVWQSQFQGRPTGLTGNMFDISKLEEISLREVPQLLFKVRAWDNAATEGAGAYTAGALMGMDAMENVYILDMVREQVGTAERQKLQEDTAEADGKLVQIHAPIDPGSAGMDVAFDFEQRLAQKGYNVTITRVTGSKEFRAYPFSRHVNSGKVKIVKGDWNKDLKTELKYFPTGTYADQADSSADGFSYLNKLFYRGLVIKNSGRSNLVGWSRFADKYGPKIPAIWEVALAIRVEKDGSKPSGWMITSRAAENAGLGETVFIVASARKFINDPSDLIVDACKALDRFCEKGVRHPETFWLGRDSLDITQLALEKHDLILQTFTDEPTAGVAETNWYFQELNDPSPFYPSNNGSMVKASRCYLLVDDNQIYTPENEDGLLSTRQELAGWAYNDKGEPQPYGGVTLDCGRMTLYNFALTATSLTKQERQIAQLPEELKPKQVMDRLGQPDFVEKYMAQQHALKKIKEREEAGDQDLEKQLNKFFGRPVQHRRNGK